MPGAIAIGVRNVPEGFAAAAPLLATRAALPRVLGFAVATGLVQPAAALLGYAVAQSVTSILPLAVTFAAGAMVYAVVDEMITESHRRGHDREATAGLVGVFAVMMLLDNAFGS